MTENPEQSATETTAAKPKRDLVADFKSMPSAEKMLAAAALSVLLGFIIDRNFGMLFRFSWFPTCAFLGAVGCIALIALEFFGVKFLPPKTRMWILILFAVLPALGFVIDALRNFWYAVMLAGAIVMGFAGVKITTREQMIKT